MPHIPTRAQIRTWTVAQLEGCSKVVDEEIWRRRDERAEAEREAEERRKAAEQAAEAARLARTHVHSKFVQQKIRCGKPNCKCAKVGRHAGSLHGGYWYRVDTFANGRRRKRYIGKTKPKSLEASFAAAPVLRPPAPSSSSPRPRARKTAQKKRAGRPGRRRP